jgi:hypothetical protein
MRSGWWSRRAITLHIALVVSIPLFLLLGAWQLRRALGGNVLSWAYVFEWPFFACYATWMWWRLVHEETALAREAAPVLESATGTGTGLSAATEPGLDDAPVPHADYDPYDEADPELAAYNRYLAGLHAEQPKR